MSGYTSLTDLQGRRFFLTMTKKKETFIRIHPWPYDHAKKAYSDGYFIEAIQVIHAFIELKLRELIFFHRLNPGPHEDFAMAMDSMFEIPFNIAVKILFIQQVIPKKVRDGLLGYNKVRNNIIHKIYFDTPNEGWIGYPKSKISTAFNSGLDLMTRLQETVDNTVTQNKRK